jgi:chromosome segregation ATPase
MPPKKRARKSKAVTPPEEQAETFTQANEVFSEDEEGDDESEEEMQQYEESESESEELDGATGEGPAGTISRMVVKNFMNHEHLKMDLKPGINFIIGKNGSGKSAMCHAAQVALGASARDTERGSSMAGFVRHGQPSCEVRLEIRNAPRDDAFEYGAYGDTIVVERTVNASGGGSYRLRAADNSVVSRKRDDLQRMLDHYNIQVNNPCSVLGQDDSKKLATGSDDYKYQFYLRASGLQTVLDQLKAAREAMKQIDEILERQGKEVPRLEQEMAGFQKEHDDASELFALQDQLDRYTHELAWSQVGDKRLEIQETQQKIDEQQSEMDKQSQTVEKLREEIAELKPKFQEGEKQMAEFNKKLSENQQKTQELKRAEDKAKKEAKRKQKEVEMKKKRISDGKTEIAGNEDEIQRIKEAPLENASAKKMQAVREKLNAKQTEVQGMHRDYKKLNDEMDQVEEDLEKLGNDEKQHKRNLDELTKGQRQAKQNLDYYKNNTGNADARFGDDLNKLMAAIDQNERKFSVKPIGPVGKYISMKDERWSDAVESAIGIGPLCTVLVQTYQDEQLCLQLAKQLRLNLRKVRFYRTKIDGGSYRDTGQLKMERFPARDKGFVSVLDVIEVTNTAVENFLYDRQMYSALLFPDREDCIKIAYKSNERNVGSCYDMEATRYYTTGGSQHQIPYRRDQREPNLMVSDNTQAIAQAERDFHEAKDKVVAEKQRFALVAKHYQREGQTPKDRAKFLQKHLAFNQKKQGQLGRNIRDLEDEMADFANEDDEEVARGNEVDGLLQASQVLEQENENLQSQMEESQRE